MRETAVFQRLPASWLVPRFAPLLQRRAWALSIVVFGVFHLGVEALGWGGAGCVFREGTGLPCPGCGLTTAARQAVAGRWAESLATHPFLSVFVAGYLTLLLAAVLPDDSRARLAAVVETWEQRSGFMLPLAAGLLGFWVWRLA